MTVRPRTTQELIHWLERGGGARWVLMGALLFGGLGVSLVVSWRQFHGAASETTLAQADIARQLASGNGFSTSINYPQAVAFLRERGVKFDAAVPYPDVYQAPLYPVVIAAGLRLLPHAARAALFAAAPAPPYGYAADYFLLVLNVLLFGAALWLSFDLGRRMFGAPAGWLSALGLFVAVPVWQQVVAVNGTALMMVLGLAAFHAWWRAESAEGPKGSAGAAAALGAICGLLFLTEYSAGALVVVAALGTALRPGPAGRAKSLLLLLGAFALVAAPWVVRNMAVTGLPVGLAAQNIALKAGDSLAEPATIRATLSAKLPALDLNKLSNKFLSAVQETLRSRAWSGGSMWFTAFFAAGWLYVFKSAPVNRLRWLFAVSLVVLVGSQAAFNSGESERLAVVWLAPLVIVFGAGFFFVLLSSNTVLGSWPRLCAGVLLSLQALPLAHDALDPHWLHFQYPPYFPQLFQGMRRQIEASDPAGRFGLMADVPAGLAWYGRARVWAQPATLRDFYAVQVEQPTGELLLTPKTLDRPFFSDLNAKPKTPGFLTASIPRIGEWGEVYGGLLTGSFPREFPLSAPRKITEDLYVLFNSSMSPGR
jgi:4-amino-4-deoxy-L-arabinose transferase-like glycosyltransferase